MYRTNLWCLSYSNSVPRTNHRLQSYLAGIKIRAARFLSFRSFSERQMPQFPQTTLQ